MYLCTGIPLGSNSQRIPTVCCSGLGMFEIVCGLLLLPGAASESVSGLLCCPGCCASGSGWKSPLSVWQSLRGKTSQTSTASQKGEGKDLNENAGKVTAVLEMCLESCFAGMRWETECARSQGLNPFPCMALLSNKHSGLISSRYLHRFARYLLCRAPATSSVASKPASPTN